MPQAYKGIKSKDTDLREETCHAGQEAASAWLQDRERKEIDDKELKEKCRKKE
jgi:hypothetical protein